MWQSAVMWPYVYVNCTVIVLIKLFCVNIPGSSGKLKLFSKSPNLEWDCNSRTCCTRLSLFLSLSLFSCLVVLVTLIKTLHGASWFMSWLDWNVLNGSQRGLTWHETWHCSLVSVATESIHYLFFYVCKNVSSMKSRFMYTGSFEASQSD